IAVINIEMDPLLLDVNVHPTKQQIRISNEKELGQLIKDAIYKQMHQEVRIPGSSGGENLRFPKAPEEKPEQLNFEFQTKNKPRDFSFPDKQKQQKQAGQAQSHFETEETEKRSLRPEPESEIRDVVNEPEVSILTHEVSMEESALELAKTAERKNYNEEKMEQFPEL